MAEHHAIWAYPWDLVDAGIDQAVSELDDLGLDAVSVATAYHTYQQLRPHRPGPKLRTSTLAHLYFQPQSSLYAGTRIVPGVAPMCARGNPLERLASACRNARMDLISWTVCLHNTDLCARLPDCAETGPYGDVSGWSLCPSSPDVRDYVTSVATDIAMNYGASRIELESCHFGGYGHAHHHVKDGLELGELGRYLLGLCFCGSCATAARELGLDPVHLRDQATALLDPAFADGRPLAEEPGSFLERRPEFAALQVMREDAVASLVDEVRKRCRTAVSFIHMGDRWSTGVVPERILQSADLLEVLAYTGSAGQVGAQVQAALTAALTPDRLLVGLQAYHPCATSAELLAAQVNAAARLGVRHFSYYNYGIMPRANLAWIRSCTSGRQDTARAG